MVAAVALGLLVSGGRRTRRRRLGAAVQRQGPEGLEDAPQGARASGRSRTASSSAPGRPATCSASAATTRTSTIRVEAKINDKGNSGQYFRTKFGPGFPPGYEAQINATHGDPIKTGSLYPTSPEGPRSVEDHHREAPHKPDEWFTQEVIANGNHIIIKVNGKTTVDWTDPKNRFKKGHFAIQQHDPGSMVKVRKIEVKELPAK